MRCPTCQFEPEKSRQHPAGMVSHPNSMSEVIPESERWQAYIAHLLEHLIKQG
jgi:hypothetical protein